MHLIEFALKGEGKLARSRDGHTGWQILLPVRAVGIRIYDGSRRRI